MQKKNVGETPTFFFINIGNSHLNAFIKLEIIIYHIALSY
ncbi:hypothetical protein BCH308197_2140 [Bacillus cereus H3081.97]|nr:hypothetical protein BCH308197_2140 [Bacillus cereus H3081.97]